MNKIVKRILLLLIFAAAVIQFIPVDHENPASDPTQDFIQIMQPPASVATTLKDACYDCHSNHTIYPWYSYVAPVSWMVADHVEHGREELNLSLWGTFDDERKEHKLEEMAEEVEEGEMPEEDYTWLHAEAQLSDAQKHELIEWLEKMHKEAH